MSKDSETQPTASHFLLVCSWSMTYKVIPCKVVVVVRGKLTVESMCSSQWESLNTK